MNAIDRVSKKLGVLSKRLRAISGTSAKTDRSARKSQPKKNKSAKEMQPKKTLQAAELIVDEILDIGVRLGTPFLYEAFPDARFVLVDPLVHRPDTLNSRPKTFKLVSAAVGREQGEARLNIHKTTGKSTMLQRTALTADEVVRTTLVKVKTIDQIIDEECSSDNIGIKLDIEGYEYEALLGLNKNTDRISFIVAECSVRKRFNDGYNFSDLVCLLREKNFIFYNFMNPVAVKAPRFYDCIFLRQDDPRFQ